MTYLDPSRNMNILLLRFDSGKKINSINMKKEVRSYYYRALLIRIRFSNMTFSLFFCRFPFYYEVKILLLIWLISPVSRGSLGSSILYRRFVHPSLIAREEVCLLWQNYLAHRIQQPILNLPCHFSRFLGPLWKKYIQILFLYLFVNNYDLEFWNWWLDPVSKISITKVYLLTVEKFRGFEASLLVDIVELIGNVQANIFRWKYDINHRFLKSSPLK